MSFDLTAKNKSLPNCTFYANISTVVLLRGAMIQAEIKEESIYKKFISRESLV